MDRAYPGMPRKVRGRSCPQWVGRESRPRTAYRADQRGVRAGQPKRHGNIAEQAGEPVELRPFALRSGEHDSMEATMLQDGGRFVFS